MARSATGHSDSFDLEHVCIARLACGATVDGLAPDWQRTFEIAIAERCAPLAWIRSAPAIRAAVPPDVSERWRSHALCATEHAHGQVAELALLLETFAGEGITPVVLKGLPLSVMLYGDIAARPVTDADLFVPIQLRAQAHRVLVRSGWRHRFGLAPGEATYQSVKPALCPYVELHSSVLDENLMSHLQVPSPEARLVDLGGTWAQAQEGALLSVFLAAHLAKHASAPLLWWIDFATLHDRLSDADRSEVTQLAVACNVDRYLDWAIDGVRLLRDALSGDQEIAVAAMRQLRAKHARHNAARVADLAYGMVDRIRVWIAWAWPRPLRSHPLAYVRSVTHRGMSWLDRRLHAAEPLR
jgi:hypothetical protein